MFWLSFEGVQAATFLFQMGLTPTRPYTDKKINADILHLLHCIENHLDAKNQLYLIGHLYLIFHALLPFQDDTRNLHKDDAEWLQKSIDFMNLHYLKISIKGVVKFAGRNRFYFTTAFTETFAITPKKYLDKIKMKKALQLLVDEPLSISDIANSIGYMDVYAFSKAFKKCFGRSPSRYKAELYSGQLDEVWLESLPKVGYKVFHDSYDECKAGETPAFYSFFGSDISIKRGPDLHGMALYNQ